LTAWRIFKAIHRRTAFTGQGARLFGGRWNRRGIPLIYTSATVSLAALELLANLDSVEVLGEFLVCDVKFDDRLIQRVNLNDLPKNWRESRAKSVLRANGTRWATAAESAVLQIPSVVVPAESNFLINPNHPDFGRIAIGRPRRFEFDRRLA
jgi:RES domain-containing protein